MLDGAQAPLPGVKYVCTLDVGITNDACVAAVAHAERVSQERGASVRVIVDRLKVWRGSRRKPVNLTEVEDWIHTASREYHHAPLHADPYQAVGLLQRLKARGVRAEQFTFSAQSVGRVANALHLALRNRLILLPDDPELVAELGRVRLRETSPGAVRLDHDSGEHDDQAVTIGIACAVLQGTQAGGPAILYRPRGRFDKRAAAGLAPAETMTPKGNVIRNPSPRLPPGTPAHIRRAFRRQQEGKGSWK